MITFTLNSKPCSLSNGIADTLSLIEKGEIWMEGHDEKKICVLLNESRAFVMYLPDNGGDSYSVVDKDEPEDEFEEFVLSNGQEDEYPKTMTVDKDTMIKILEHYYKTGNQYQGVQWVEE
jgi:hypothetical protein